MASNRISRINEELQRELSALIRSLKDPRVQQSMVSVTKVEATGDLRYAKVYISVLDKDKSRETLKGLKSAGGFLRREIAARLDADTLLIDATHPYAAAVTDNLRAGCR